ncbi:hypothetical protein E3N88_05764 [Mikania micrantha]|uniref:Uncharacterized protein n=1 Tax=Mikania micrantha TaxID=192012 RepID=A0A5N6PLW9_9ASTR|nr:hypothetical protein E3N88_05764 [Mikania micrantha]
MQAIRTSFTGSLSYLPDASRDREPKFLYIIYLESKDVKNHRNCLSCFESASIEEDFALLFNRRKLSALKMKRKDADEVNDDFFDFTMTSPALKIRRLDVESTPIIDEHETLNSVEFGQSMPFQNNLVEESMESSPIAIHELNNSVPVNEERAIVLFNPQNNTPSLKSPISFSISADSDFLSRFKNPVIWSNGSDETQKKDDDSGVINGCLAVVPWVPNHSRDPPTVEYKTSDAQASDDMMDSNAMDVEDDYNTQQMIHHVPTNVQWDWNQWQQHCMIQQPPNNFSTPITWFG